MSANNIEAASLVVDWTVFSTTPVVFRCIYVIHGGAFWPGIARGSSLIQISPKLKTQFETAILDFMAGVP